MTARGVDTVLEVWARTLRSRAHSESSLLGRLGHTALL